MKYGQDAHADQRKKKKKKKHVNKYANIRRETYDGWKFKIERSNDRIIAYNKRLKSFIESFVRILFLIPRETCNRESYK
jgi:hypothetical protein